MVKCEMVKYDTSITEPPFEFIHVGEFEIDDSDSGDDSGDDRYNKLSHGCAKHGQSMQSYSMGENGSPYKYSVIVHLTPEEYPQCRLGIFGCDCNKEQSYE